MPTMTAMKASSASGAFLTPAYPTRKSGLNCAAVPHFVHPVKGFKTKRRQKNAGKPGKPFLRKGRARGHLPLDPLLVNRISCTQWENTRYRSGQGGTWRAGDVRGKKKDCGRGMAQEERYGRGVAGSYPLRMLNLLIALLSCWVPAVYND